MSIRFLVSFLLCSATAVYGISGSSRKCETDTIDEAWPGGYKGTISFSAPSDYSSVSLDVQFIHSVATFQIYSGGSVEKISDTEFVYTESASGSAGSSLAFEYQIDYDEQQPLMGAIQFNGEDVCGDGGGLSTAPPLENPCSSTGTGPYDYPQVLCMAILFYEAQRSGPIPSDQRITWRWDSSLDDGSDVGLDLSGGYHDAGDHVKFGFPMAFTGTLLGWGMIEYEDGFRAAGEYDNGRAAVRWASDYFLKAHSASGTLYGQVGDGNLDHAYWGRPEEMTMDRPSAKIDAQNPGSDLAGETAAALAAASIVFADDSTYSSECLAAARDLYTLADENRGIYTASITGASGFYDSFSGYGDELAWAAIWLYKATGEAEYLTKAKEHWNEFGLNDALQFGWDDKTAGCFALFAELDGGSEYTSALTNFVDQTINEDTYTPGGMVYLDQWGAMRHAMNVAFIAHRAADLGFSSSTYRDWATGQLNYALGSNGQSFVVGYGDNAPQRPHHRASSCPQYPSSCTDSWAQYQEGANPHVLYGALVGGPDGSDSYTDDRNDYVHNEVACDYNAGFVGVLAATVQNTLR